MHRRGLLGSALLLSSAAAGLAGCSSSKDHAAGDDPPALLVHDAWVRTTTGKKDRSMSAAFMDITNPTDKEVRLVKASTDASARTELHEMVASKDGRKMMQEAKGGITVPAGGHRHLVSGGNHIMIMGLTKELKVGQEVAITLEFDDSTTLKVAAMVKEFVEEEDHYHTTPVVTPTP